MLLIEKFKQLKNPQKDFILVKCLVLVSIVNGSLLYLTQKNNALHTFLRVNNIVEATFISSNRLDIIFTLLVQITYVRFYVLM